MRLYVLTRHAQSTLNLEHRVNGDPAVPVPLTDDGVENARRLAVQLANLPIELAVHTRFERTRRTAELAVAGRGIPLVEEPDLDDIRLGELEGATIDEYRAWKRGRTRSEPFPGGESLDDAARRYADAFDRLLARAEQVVLVVAHEIPIRYALNAAAGSPTLDGPVHDVPNATPFLFEAAALDRATRGLRARAGASAPSA